MGNEMLCWNCIYGENTTGHSVSCMNKTVSRFKIKPDKYYCEFYEQLSDDYMSDMEKVWYDRED